MHSSTSFDKCTQLVNHRNQDTEQFHHPPISLFSASKQSPRAPLKKQVCTPLVEGGQSRFASLNCGPGWLWHLSLWLRALGEEECAGQGEVVLEPGREYSKAREQLSDAPAAWGRCGACSLHGDHGLGWHPCVPGPGLAASLNTAFRHLGILCRARDGFVALGNCASSGSQRLPDTGAPGGAQEQQVGQRLHHFVCCEGSYQADLVPLSWGLTTATRVTSLHQACPG